MQAFVSLVVAFMMIGCAPARFYDGPRLPEGHTALIETQNRFLRYATAIDRVDGSPVSESLWGGGRPRRVEVLPGTHTIMTSSDYTDWIAGHYQGTPLRIAFTAEAGQQYLIKSDFDRDRKTWSAWIEREGTVVSDLKTGLMVPVYMDYQHRATDPFHQGTHWYQDTDGYWHLHNHDFDPPAAGEVH